MIYVIRPEADRDLDEIAEDLLDHAGLEMSLRFLKRVDETFSLLAGQPDIGWPCKLALPELKRVRVFRTANPFGKYLIFYRRTAKKIEIVRVLHGSQTLEEKFRR